MAETALGLCEENREVAIILFVYVQAAFHAFGAITTIPPMYIYCKSYFQDSQQKSKPAKLLFWAGFLLFASCWAHFAASVVSNIYYCYDPSETYANYLIISTTCIVLYLTQSIILLQILFYRLHFTFESSDLALSKCTTAMWIAFSIFTSLFFILGLIIHNIHMRYHSISIPLILLGGILSALSTIWLVCMFAYKLAKVHKSVHSVHDDGKKEINVVSKLALLCFVSAFFYLLNVVTGIFIIGSGVYLQFTWQMFAWVDVYTSFLCILLSFRYFENWYQKLCGPSHACCFSVWAKCFRRNTDVENIMKVVEATVASASSSTPELSNI